MAELKVTIPDDVLQDFLATLHDEPFDDAVARLMRRAVDERRTTGAEAARRLAAVEAVLRG